MKALPKFASIFTIIAAIAGISASMAVAQPAVTTDPATNVAVTTATLNATIYPHGEGGSYAFEWGTSTKYGNYTEARTIKAGKYGALNVSEPINGLSSATTYHFRIWALTTGKPVAGEDVTFTTLSGLFLTGEESEEEASQPGIDTTESKLAFAVVSPGTTFRLLQPQEWGSSVDCSSGGFYAGSITASEPLSSFSLSAGGFEECEFEGISTAVKTNGCEYVYSIANVGPPYSGSVDEISCAAGKAIELAISGFCTLKIPSQTLEASTSYQETGYEGLGAVAADTSSSGIAYEKVPASGPYCFLFENGTGTFGGSMTIF